ncbi:Cell wall-associated hydrolase, NlpC family [Amphibacillus marinus]|uniref:Cell wall-associated hydrolase, NlpC family n=1 Tax=Amphibacillus marinus TaxID=872970 RepID=A0A1H8GML1_9BACI|nr:Cell wall-associated hydrolase, NlpC family [Amphibacillus marinus]
MAQAQLNQIVKQTVAYSYMVSQPFSVYVDAYPVFQNYWLMNQEEHVFVYGQHSTTIRIIQQKLNNLHYYDETIDGEFGLLTEYALKKFQREHFIEIDGTINTETIQAIMDAEYRFYLSELKSFDRSFQFGEKNEEVEKLQKALFYFGFYQANIDQIYGPITEAALLEAKEAFSLPMTVEITEAFVETIQAETVPEIVEPKQKTDNTSKQEVKQIKKIPQDSNQIIESAKALQGIPYLWGGTSTSGFDCSGFLQYVFSENSITIPRTVADIWNQSSHVDQASLGDIVFFETYKKGPSHAGIYLGNDQFIHASASNGVTISNLTESYWQQRYLGSRRISN